VSFLFAYLLTAPSLEKRYQVYCQTPFFAEELSGYALNLGPTSQEELLDWGKAFNSCLVVADNILIAKAIALYKKRPGLFWLKNASPFFKLPLDYLWPLPTKVLIEFLETGFKTIGSLQIIPLETLRGRLGDLGEKIYHYCRGHYTGKILPHPPAFEKRFSEKDLEQVLFSLIKQLPPHTCTLWLYSGTGSVEINQDKIGIATLKKSLATLYPWEFLVALSWEAPSLKQAGLFDFNLPEALEQLLEKENHLRLGLPLNRREQVRRANFIWGYATGF